MNYLIDFVVGFLRGGFGVILVVVLLFFVANVAFGDDTVATRPAELGEQDRSFNYKYTDPSGHEWEHTIVLWPDTEASDEDVMDCEETNARLQVAKDKVEKHIEDNPKFGFLYDEVLELIEEVWCHDND